jgi:sucrose-6-phosphate hydrolase SacC (GH32 family)
VSYSGFIDLDKNNLFNIKRISEKPILTLGELGCFDEFGTYPVSVIDINNKPTVFYAGWTRCNSVPFNVAIGSGISNDNGETFQKLGNGPVLSYTIDEPFVLSGPKIRKFNDVYYLFYIAGTKWILDNGKPEPVYRIKLATSNDGKNWTKLNKNLIDTFLEEDEAQASPDVIFKNGKYHMFFCYRKSKNYRCKENGYRIGYAWSLDLINWNRENEKVGIDVSQEGWDAEMVSYPHVFELKNKIYMMYLGNQVGKTGFGLAELEGELI